MSGGQSHFVWLPARTMRPTTWALSARVASRTESRKIPTQKILPHFSLTASAALAWLSSSVMFSTAAMMSASVSAWDGALCRPLLARASCRLLRCFLARFRTCAAQ